MPEGKGRMKLKRRAYLMDTMVSASLMYAAEVWGWRKWKMGERGKSAK